MVFYLFIIKIYRWIAVQALEKRTADLKLGTLEFETFQRQVEQQQDLIESMRARLEQLENH